MCGIIASNGKNIKQVLLAGLYALEYRGYDSAGFCAISEKGFEIHKSIGPISNLDKKIKEISDTNWSAGIGHTRWATHGEANLQNCHPQLSSDGKFALVHNGIVENFAKLKNELIAQGMKFSSATDSEVIVNLLAKHYQEKPDFRTVMIQVAKQLRGRFAVVCIHHNFPDTLLALRSGSPLVLGVTKNSSFIASDPHAFPNDVHQIYFLPENTCLVAKKDNVHVYDFAGIEKEIIFQNFQKPVIHVTQNFNFQMEKEIFDQSSTVSRYLLQCSAPNYFQELSQKLTQNPSLQIIGCGSAYISGLFGKYLLKNHLSQVQVEIASEMRYFPNKIKKNDNILLLSQSGETADTLACLDLAKKFTSNTFALTNNPYSTLGREAHSVFDLNCDRELAVASTKAVMHMYLFFNLLNFHLQKKVADTTELNSDLLEQFIVATHKNFATWTEDICEFEEFFFLGRGENYVVALEAALKFNELCYLHSQAYPAGELKHGPLALVNPNTLCVVFGSEGEVSSKIESNIEEVKARGAKVLLIAKNKYEKADYFWAIPEYCQEFSPLYALISSQILSFQVAKKLGNNIDRPRNLAKSVTVE